MTATSAVSPGRSASPGSSGSRPNPWSAIAGALVASPAPGMLTTAKIAVLIGVPEVHHGCRC